MSEYAHKERLLWSLEDLTRHLLELEYHAGTVEHDSAAHQQALAAATKAYDDLHVLFREAIYGPDALTHHVRSTCSLTIPLGF